MSFSFPITFTIESVSRRDNDENIVTSKVNSQNNQIQTSVEINDGFIAGLRNFLRQIPGNDDETINQAINDFFETNLPQEESSEESSSEESSSLYDSSSDLFASSEDDLYLPPKKESSEE